MSISNYSLLYNITLYLYKKGTHNKSSRIFSLSSSC